MSLPTDIAMLFVATYNADLAELGSLARVTLPDPDKHPDTLELRRGDGELLDLIPADTEPVMAAIACRLYDEGYNEGRRAGENHAWASLRSLIGAAPSQTPKRI
ncbi:hypothetical protein [Novosphingobium lindaniclasticum]